MKVNSDHVARLSSSVTGVPKKGHLGLYKHSGKMASERLDRKLVLCYNVRVLGIQLRSLDLMEGAFTC